MTGRLLLHTPGWSPAPVADALAAEGVAARAFRPLDDLPADAAATVLVCDADAWPTIADLRAGALRERGIPVVLLGAAADADAPEGPASDLVTAFIPAPATPRRVLLGLRAAWREALVRRQLAAARTEAAERAGEVRELAEIGARLLTERDLPALLELILTLARRVTQSDAGSLYLVERADDGEQRLRFTLAQNATRPDIPFRSVTIPLDPTSLAGHAAASGEPLVLDDVYALPPDVPYAFNRSFDEQYGYRTRSVLVVPMPNQRGEVTGVLQLINRKVDGEAPLTGPDDVARRVRPYDAHAVRLARALAGQAAVSIENSQLYQEIERLFEGFVRAAVSAIEQRDPATSGHSERVARMSVSLAQVVDRAPDGPYAAVRFSADQLRELRYASLLHDFGKVGVREHVLVKGAKLYPADLALIEERQAFLWRSAEWQFERARAEYLEQAGRDGYDAWLAEARGALDDEFRQLRAFLDTVRECNQPSVLVEPHGPKYQALAEYARRRFEGVDGRERPYLTPLEFAFLSIRKGTLDETERLEIESHVTHTYGFLQRIPWTAALRGVPEIAHGHHEKLDGTGYPRGMRAAQIPLQTRIMTISDIFDALTASDRPYKRAVAVPRALDILAEEAKGGQVDADLFRMFVEARAYEASRPSP